MSSSLCYLHIRFITIVKIHFQGGGKSRKTGIPVVEITFSLQAPLELQVSMS